MPCKPNSQIFQDLKSKRRLGFRGLASIINAVHTEHRKTIPEPLKLVNFCMYVLPSKLNLQTILRFKPCSCIKNVLPC